MKFLRPFVAFSAVAFFAAPAQAFEWDDGRGVLPYKSATTRHYIAADEAPRAFHPAVGDYRSIISLAIARQARRYGQLGRGAATVDFHIDAAGRIYDARLISATSPTHGAAAMQALAGVRTPPPPHGKAYARQRIEFH